MYVCTPIRNSDMIVTEFHFLLSLILKTYNYCTMHCGWIATQGWNWILIRIYTIGFWFVIEWWSNLCVPFLTLLFQFYFKIYYAIHLCFVPHLMNVASSYSYVTQYMAYSKRTETTRRCAEFYKMWRNGHIAQQFF